jgi:hypothetical protein
MQNQTVSANQFLLHAREETIADYAEIQNFRDREFSRSVSSLCLPSLEFALPWARQ